MFQQSEYERLREAVSSNQREIEKLERIYKRGAGCFGIGRGAPEIKKEIEKLKKKKF